MTPEQRQQHIINTLEATLNATKLEVTNESHLHVGHAGSKDGASHFFVSLASPQFKDKSLLECHRMVLALFADLIPHEIHALRIKTLES